MRINEVVKRTGLTKKAIRFYEQEELIAPLIDKENSYRSYSEEDVKRLLEITIFRGLDMPIKDIKLAFQTSSSLNQLLENHKACLERDMEKLEKNITILNSILDNKDKSVQEVTSKLKVLSDSIALDNKEKANYIREELLRVFPGTYGKIIVSGLSPFLNIKIDTEEKEKGVPSNFLDENSEKIAEGVDKILNMSKEEQELLIQKMLGTVKKLSSDENSRDSFRENYNIGKAFKEEMSKSGFYDVFMKNFYILNEDYKKYNDLFKEVGKELKYNG
jgi:DNA-binding transcriptional MerR regulator